MLRKILEQRENKLPWSISEQKHNDQIKIIGKLVGITEEALLTKICGGKSKPKYKFIITHAACIPRVTNMYLAGIPL